MNKWIHEQTNDVGQRLSPWTAALQGTFALPCECHSCVWFKSQKVLHPVKMSSYGSQGSCDEFTQSAFSFELREQLHRETFDPNQNNNEPLLHLQGNENLTALTGWEQVASQWFACRSPPGKDLKAQIKSSTQSGMLSKSKQRVNKWVVAGGNWEKSQETPIYTEAFKFILVLVHTLLP